MPFSAGSPGQPVGCNFFMQEDCVYTGPQSVLLDVNDLDDCQATLGLGGENFGATYSVFNRITDQCKFYETRDKKCISFSGPKYPSFGDCGITPP